MTARESVLRDIRAALGREAGQAPAPAPPSRIRIPESEVDARIESLFRSLEKLAGRTYLALSPEDARNFVAEVICGEPSVASNAPILREWGIAGLPSVATGFQDREALQAACAAAAFGITSADYALADTGTLVMIASPEEARLVSLLPPVHIAVIPRARILTGLDELLSILPHPADLTSSMVLITGPSRTADIEQILVRGVHGPGEIHVIVV
jgi:L-lactate dehydrogenase complex protein LldG